MAIHHALRLLTATYYDEPTHIFTNCLNVLYLLNTQIKHPPYITTHNVLYQFEPIYKNIWIHK